MLRNYLKVALRNLSRHKGYTAINGAGLAVGVSCCLLILAYVRDEVSYDRHHENADRIVRIADHFTVSGNHYDVATTPVPWGPALVAEYPDVERMTRLFNTSVNAPLLVRYEDQSFYEEHFFFADSAVFDVFTVPLHRGNPETALDAPFSVVVSERVAERYFGTADPMGQTIVLGDTTRYVVTGVMADAPANAHLRPDFLASFSSLRSLGVSYLDSWTVHGPVYTYLLLDEEFAPDALEAEFPAFLQRHMEDELAERYAPELQPLTRIHLHSDVGFDFTTGGSVTYVYLFTAIALFVLLIACVNFMNLATARSIERTKEVGLRKVIGAKRRQLIGQFLGEAVLLSLLAVAAAVVLARFGLPVLNRLSGKALTMSFFGDPMVVAGLLGAGIGIGIVSGSYPAFVLSRFEPARVLRGASGSRGGTRLRRGLVVFQFATSIVLMAATLIIYKQLDYVRTKELGFDREQIVVARIQSPSVGQRRAELKQELLRHPAIQQVATSSQVPGQFVSGLMYQPEGFSADERMIMSTLVVDHDFVETLGIEIAQGRAFAEIHPSDSSAFVLNEAAVRKLGWTEPVGKHFELWNPTGTNSYELQKEGPVIGVVEDFHVASLHEQIEPLVLHIQPDGYAAFSIRVDAEHMSEALAFLEQTWARFAPGRPFQYTFLDDRYAALYQSEERLGTIFFYFAGLAIFIACLGLFGLAGYTIRQRTQEIGVRKVLGASVASIVALLSKEFVALVGVAFFIAVPVAYGGMQQWLQGFAYRVELGAGVFLLGGGLAVSIALLAVSYQVIRAARTDPVESLRYE